MPYYTVTGMHSHRHPFYGFGATTPLDTGSVMAPVWAGLIMGLASYSLAGAMGIDKGKAAGLGLALGATIAIGQIGSAWLQGYLAKAQAVATAPVVPALTPAPVTAPAVAPAPIASSVQGW